MRAPRSPLGRAVAALLSLAAVALVGILLPGTAAAAVPRWAPAALATIHPGVVTDSEGGGCTANFVFSNGSDVFIGQAAHCATTGGQTAADGCTTGTRPLGTKVAIQGASRPGTMVYSSWVTMQQRHETDPNACAYNDLALVRVDPADVGRVNPSVPFWGGPTGLDTNGTAFGDGVESYSESPLGLGIPKTGISLGDDGAGWSHVCYTVTPGIPGDSGSGFLSNDGTALGVLSTVTVLPLVASNGVGDLAKELAYLNSVGGLGTVQLALGTEPFRGSLLP